LSPRCTRSSDVNDTVGGGPGNKIIFENWPNKSNKCTCKYQQ